MPDAVRSRCQHELLLHVFVSGCRPDQALKRERRLAYAVLSHVLHGSEAIGSENTYHLVAEGGKTCAHEVTVVARLRHQAGGDHKPR